MRRFVRHAWKLCALVLAVLLPLSATAQEKKLPVKIAVGGIPFVPYLPATLAKELGEYDKAGLAVELIGFKGGSVAATAVVGGSADVASGYYDHTIQLAAKGKAVRAFVIATRLPALALYASPRMKDSIKSVKDLQGKKVGVTAPGSSTDFMLKFALQKAGVPAGTVSVVGVGEPASAVAAAEQGLVDAVLHGEPTITLMEKKYPGLPMLLDTRTEAGTRGLFGGDYPSASLYATTEWLDKHPEEARRLALAMIATLRWMHSHTIDEIVAKVPKEIVGPDPALYAATLKSSMPTFSRDGMNSLKGAEIAYGLLADSVPEMKGAKIDLAATFTNTYAEEANKKLGPIK